MVSHGRTLVIFDLFDEELDSNERKAMFTRLRLLPNQRNFAPEKPAFPVDLIVGNLELGSFVGSRSWMLFNILYANGTWLHNDVCECHRSE